MNVTKIVSCIKTPFTNAVFAVQKGAEKSILSANPMKTDSYKKTVSILKSVFSRHTSEFTKAYIESLPPEIYNECLKLSIYNKQLCGDAKIISEYGELVQSALRRTMGTQKYQLIGIGRSPSMTIEYLKLKGENAISIPISQLSSVENVEKELIKNPGVENYFEYLKKLGFDIDKLDKDTTYIFTDFADTGKSLEVFQQFMKAKLPEGTKSYFWKLQDIPKMKMTKATPEQLSVLWYFEEELYYRDITRRCSPIERVPYPKMGDIQQICERPNPFGGYINQLKLLLYDIGKRS